MQTRRQTDSQTTRVRHGHKSGGRFASASHRSPRWRSNQWPGPRRAQRQHTHAHVRPFFVRRPSGLLPGSGVRSWLASHEVGVHTYCSRL